MKIDLSIVIVFLSALFILGITATCYGIWVLFQHAVWLGLMALIPCMLWILFYGSLMLSIFVSYADFRSHKSK